MIRRLSPFPVCMILMIVVLSGCRTATPNLSVASEPSPIAAESLVPQMTALSGGRILLSWQRPLSSGGYAFEMAIQNGSRWSAVRTIAEGPKLSMFTADLPGVENLDGTRLLAYWEIKDDAGGDRFATSIKTAISADEGKSWFPTPTPYNDALAGQHSFLSSFGAKEGVGLLWLDASARSQVRHAQMEKADAKMNLDLGSVGLRYALLTPDGKVAHEQFVDPITCECCPTSAASTIRGPVVVYRGRQEASGTLPSEVRDSRPTVRDIYIVRMEEGAWRKPHLVHKDDWIINACPDNGPAVDASANHVAVAWWTRSSDQPKVQMAFSADSGDSFGSAFRIDSEKGEGQVTVSLLPGGRSAVVGWLENGKTWARFVNDSGAMSQPMPLGPSPHHSRLPRWLANRDGSVMAAWTSRKNGSSHLEICRIQMRAAD